MVDPTNKILGNRKAKFMQWLKTKGLGMNDTITEFVEVINIAGNVFTLANPLTITPQVDFIIDMACYNDMNITATTLYAFMNDNATFDDGTTQYTQL